jgi:tetratricopeptide (TPR) repeat protein
MGLAKPDCVKRMESAFSESSQPPGILQAVTPYFALLSFPDLGVAVSVSKFETGGGAMFFNSSKSTIQTLGIASILMLAGSIHAQNIVTKGQPAAITILDSTKEQDGLIGSVRRVRTESAKLELQGERLVEGPRQLLEITTYGPRGNRVENVSYPSSSLVGKEEYTYDDKGNIVEMTLRDENGTILSREAYDYAVDRFGNWTKMVTSLLVFQDGTLKHEPIEVTYRTLTYYFDEQIAKIVEPDARQRMPELPAVSELKVSDFPVLAERPGTLSSGNTPGAPLVPGLGTPPELTESAEAAMSAPATRTDGEPPSSSSLQANLLSSSAPTANIAAHEEARAEEVASKNSPPRENASSTKGLEYFKAGRNRFDEGDLKGAVAAYLQSIELQPDSAEVHLSLGLVYLKLEKNKEAAKAFKDSLRLQPDVAEAQYGLGLAYFRMTRHRDAAEAFKRATILRPDLAKAHYGLALAYQELGKNDALIAEFKILETLDPSLAKRLAPTLPDPKKPCSLQTNGALMTLMGICK